MLRAAIPHLVGWATDFDHHALVLNRTIPSKASHGDLSQLSVLELSANSPRQRTGILWGERML